MKKRITKEQIQELSDKGWRNLAEWRHPQGNNKSMWEAEEWQDRLMALDWNLDIADMIELLTDKGVLQDIRSPLGYANKNIQGWTVYLFWEKGEKSSFREVELCDALWQVVKTVLEK